MDLFQLKEINEKCFNVYNMYVGGSHHAIRIFNAVCRLRCMKQVEL